MFLEERAKATRKGRECLLEKRSMNVLNLLQFSIDFTYDNAKYLLLGCTFPGDYGTIF